MDFSTTFSVNIGPTLVSMINIYGICHRTFARKSPLFFESSHYSYVIMSAMASQITSFMIVYSTVYSRRRSKKTSRLRVTALCAGNTPVTGEFPAPLQWRHNGHNSQITSLTTVYSTVYSDADQRKRGKCFHLMTSSCILSTLRRFRFNEILFNWVVIKTFFTAIDILCIIKVYRIRIF